MKIQYVPKRFGAHAQQTIDAANAIIAEYEKQGFDLTLRQLYYQFVSRDLIPNTMKDYKKLGLVINDARLAGLISWKAIVDRTRNLESNAHWETPNEIIEICSRQYKLDRWKDQDYRVEVWIEKDALIGVIEQVCKSNDVPYFSCRGYTSQSEMWSAAQRLNGYYLKKQIPVIIHLGDHDPSGKDMTRDIEDRLKMFTGEDVAVNRIALNMDQVRKYKPPPNPAKITDTRARNYIKQFGQQSWELDALDPSLLYQLIDNTIDQYRDQVNWDKTEKLETRDKKKLVKLSKDFK